MFHEDYSVKKQPKKLFVPKTIAFVGLMGAGKSSVGWRLAKRLGLPFFDSDREVEKAAGCSISDIYALWGEKAFKEAERKVIHRLLSGPPHVLSTGDASFVPQDLREMILDKTITIWLQADLETIHQRVKHRQTRPQLFEGDSLEILSELVEERYNVYNQAHFSVESCDETHDQTVSRIINTLNTYLAQKNTTDFF